MSLDSSLLLKVKEHVTSKLKSIGAFIDEELPDYIMVMVANKKSESSMTTDLQLFLGDDAAGFTKWLHQTLQTLKSPNQATSKDKVVSRGSSKSKSSGKKTSKAYFPDDKSHHSKSRNRSRSRSPLKSHSFDRNDPSSREPHAESDLLNIHPEENEFTSEDISSTANIQEERKVVSTSRFSLTPEKLHDSSSLQSVIQVKKAEKRVRPDCLENAGRASGRLLKRAVEEVRSSIHEQHKHMETDDHPPSRRKRIAINRTVECPDVSSSSVTSTAGVSELDTRFYITLSGSTDAQPTFDDDDSVPTSVSASTASVKARLGRRHIVAYPDQEQHQSKGVLVTSTCRPSVRDRLGPRVQTLLQKSGAYPAYQHSDKIDVYAETLNDDFAGDDSVEIEEEIVGNYASIEIDDASTDPGRLTSTVTTLPARGRTVNAISADPVSRTVRNNSKMRLIDQLNQHNLMVSLSEPKEDAISATIDTHPLVTVGKNSINMSSESTNKVNNTAAGGAVANFPSLKRCKFWPHCRNAEKCAFMHPSQACPAFPRCGLASTCCFIHPPCRYGISCIRKNCVYDHSASVPPALPVNKAVPVMSPDKMPCRYGKGCTRPQCPFYHHRAKPELTDKIGSSSVGTNDTSGARVAPKMPLTISPIPCRYGSACTSRPKCPFLHVDLPRPDQLKWKAVEKGLAQGEGEEKQNLVETSTSPSGNQIKSTS